MDITLVLFSVLVASSAVFMFYLAWGVFKPDDITMDAMSWLAVGVILLLDSAMVLTAAGMAQVLQWGLHELFWTAQGWAICAVLWAVLVALVVYLIYPLEILTLELWPFLVFVLRVIVLVALAALVWLFLTSLGDLTSVSGTTPPLD